MNLGYLSRRAIVCLGAAVTVLTGCVPDDQTVIKPEHLPVANPVPKASVNDPARFKANNDRHKILLGVFDTGVDYNHPYLADHIHFDLDEKGQPIGAGKDYLALDDWASPRIIETSSYEFQFLSEKQKRRALDTYKTEEAFNNHVRRTRMGKVCAADALAEVQPNIKNYLQAYRDTDFEDSETKHGTHVAGLMSYDVPEIGLIPYKILPYYQNEKDEADFTRGKADRFVTNFEDAVAHAHKRGVKIVNLSLGGSFEKPTNSNDSAYEEKLEKYNNYKRLLTEGITEIVKKYHDVLFVAAAGNDSGWSDNEARLQYPCGIEAPNILCVGALNKDGRLANFTNLPLNHIDLVLASGVKLISTVPSDNCSYLRSQFNNILTQGTNWQGICKYDLKEKKWNKDSDFLEKYRALIGTLASTCGETKSLFEPMSGTSMATPVVSRLAALAWLEKPTMSPKEVIAALKDNAEVDTSRQFIAYILKAKQPSWYQLFQNSKEGKKEGIDLDPNFSRVMRLPFANGFDGVIRTASVKTSWLEFLINRK